MYERQFIFLFQFSFYCIYVDLLSLIQYASFLHRYIMYVLLNRYAFSFFPWLVSNTGLNTYQLMCTYSFFFFFFMYYLHFNVPSYVQHLHAYVYVFLSLRTKIFPTRRVLSYGHFYPKSDFSIFRTFTINFIVWNLFISFLI